MKKLCTKNLKYFSGKCCFQNKWQQSVHCISYSSQTFLSLKLTGGCCPMPPHLAKFLQQMRLMAAALCRSFMAAVSDEVKCSYVINVHATETWDILGDV